MNLEKELFEARRRNAYRLRYAGRKFEAPVDYRLAIDKWTPREKNDCRMATNVLIREGVLVRQACERCGAGPGQAHHESYVDPMAVRWLCRRCHSKWHRIEKKTRGRAKFYLFIGTIRKPD